VGDAFEVVAASVKETIRRNIDLGKYRDGGDSHLVVVLDAFVVNGGISYTGVGGDG
jgi:hypothetical protein